MCVHVDDIPAGIGLAPLNCPVACNPLSDATELEATCGAERICCQTLALGPEDCVKDDESDIWRPMTSEEAGYTVATERGFCLAAGSGQFCPGIEFANGCEQINLGFVDPPE